MMNKPRLLDLFCGAGGCSMGYHRAGFEVVGVDIAPQPNYPFEFIQADAMEFSSRYGREFDVIHASPPCQRFSKSQRIRGRDHPDLISATRDAMPRDVPWIIENVPGSPLNHPVILCGYSFGLRTYRHRLFESSELIVSPPHRIHDIPTTKMGRTPQDGEMMHVVGHFSGLSSAREAMGIDWMTSKELSQAIPPAYTEWIGKQLTTAGGS